MKQNVGEDDESDGRLTISTTVKGVEELVANFDSGSAAAGYLSIVIALSFWATVWWLEGMGGSILFQPWIRKLLSDYAYPVSTSSHCSNVMHQLIIILPDCHHLLDGLLPHSRPHQRSRPPASPHHTCILPIDRPQLVD